jgi:hypothetical protein
MNLAIAGASLYSEELEPGTWCCIGCETAFALVEDEDHHFATCEPAQRLLAERGREFGTGRPRWDDD